MRRPTGARRVSFRLAPLCLLLTLLFGGAALAAAPASDVKNGAAGKVGSERAGRVDVVARAGAAKAAKRGSGADDPPGAAPDPGSGVVPAPVGRISWREVSNWRELHDAAKK